VDRRARFSFLTDLARDGFILDLVISGEQEGLAEDKAYR
jgi:hypothetical protein